MDEIKSAVVKVLESKANEVRRISDDLGLDYREEELPSDEGVLKFVYRLNDIQLSRLVSAIPMDAYALKARFE